MSSKVHYYISTLIYGKPFLLPQFPQNSILIFSGTKGPVHTFNSYKANFYISTGQDGCSVDGNSKTDADYFCRSFYGIGYNATSYKRGSYIESGQMGYQMHRKPNCFSNGEDIYGTNDGSNNYYNGKMKIWQTGTNYQGLYDIVCSNAPGMNVVRILYLHSLSRSI